MLGRTVAATLLILGGWSGVAAAADGQNEALMRLRRSLDEFVIGGIETTLPLHRRILGSGDFVDGAYDIHWLERFVDLKR